MTRLLDRFPAWKIDTLLVSGPPNVRYLTGFTGSNALLAVSRHGVMLFTDPRYKIQAQRQVSCDVRIAKGTLAEEAAKWIARNKCKRIGFEKGRMVYAEYEALREKLPLGASLHPLGAVVEELRMVKSAGEIEKIRRSVLTNSLALDSALPMIRPGISENEVAAELEHQMRRHGAEGPAFDTIVAAGERTALPHADPGGTALEMNQLLLIDMGARQEGYTSDMTRMFALGRVKPELRRMHAAVLRAQLSAIDSVRDGALPEKVDRAARQALKSEGLDKMFVHSTGHGLGLEIHEAPRLGRRLRMQAANTVLRAGMAVTIEPGAYAEGLGGVRIEDTVLVTTNGCEVLTPTPKELVSL